MSLLYKAGAIVIRAGSLVYAAAQACIDACCGNWFCCWDEGYTSSSCQDSPCPEGATRSGPYASAEDCEPQCDLPPEYYCCWADEEKSYSVCQPGPCPEGMERSGPYENQMACEEPCDEPPQWYCCWDMNPQTSEATSACQPDPCPEGFYRSGPYDSEQDCSSPCDQPWTYYCCVDEETGEPLCELGFGCPDGTIQVGGPYHQDDCPENCYEAVGACCEEPGQCNFNTDCSDAYSYWAKNECGECVEFTQESSGWSQNQCRVYSGYLCDFQTPLGWVSYELCRDDGLVYQDCQDEVPASACIDPSQTWHPNMMCYQVNCPGDCYDTNTITPCKGSSGTPSNGNCQLLWGYWDFACGNDVEVTIEIYGVSSSAACPSSDPYPDGTPDTCSTDPVTATARSMLEGLLNATFTLPKGDPSTGIETCAEPLEVCDDTGSVNANGQNLQIIVKATISLESEDVSSGSYEPGQPECGKNACFRVKIDYLVCVHAAEEGPYDCDSFSYCQYQPHACGSVFSEKGCVTFEIDEEHTKACDCFPKSYNCSGAAEGLSFDPQGSGPVFSGPCEPGCCFEDLFDGATVSITFAEAP